LDFRLRQPIGVGKGGGEGGGNIGREKRKKGGTRKPARYGSRTTVRRDRDSAKKRFCGVESNKKGVERGESSTLTEKGSVWLVA